MQVSSWYLIDSTDGYHPTALAVITIDKHSADKELGDMQL